MKFFCIILGLAASSNVISTIATSDVFEDAIPEGFSTSNELDENEKLEDANTDDAAKDVSMQETTPKDDNTETKGGNHGYCQEFPYEEGSFFQEKGG